MIIFASSFLCDEAAILNRVISTGLIEKAASEQDIEGKELASSYGWRERVVWATGAAVADSLKQKRSWCVRGLSKRPAWLERASRRRAAEGEIRWVAGSQTT